MASLRITKKHHRHLNNPLPSPPKSLPFLQGTLLLEPTSVLLSTGVYPIGQDFQLAWSSKNGGCFSISHRSQPAKSIWSTVPGQAFVSAAMAETEVEESRGSFLVKDGKVHLLCDHQTVEEISIIDNLDSLFQANEQYLPSGFLELDQNEMKYMKFPVLVISGQIFSKNKKQLRDFSTWRSGHIQTKEASISVRYWVFFDQKSSRDIGFRVKLRRPNFHIINSAPRRYRGIRLKIGRTRKKKLGWFRFFPKPRSLIAVAASEEEAAEVQLIESMEFNRVCFTYSSEESERFYGFGEQFSYMDLKGKRVPIFVQEQGIGRGDQPITFAANLVSHRAGGDWSTTYAPSPFYMTSRMRSLYLEGYEYSIFDLTRRDRVQIQIYGNSVQGRLFHGNSPTELIEQFTENIGRPPELPEWIISGAVVGMQGGTDIVYNVWDELKAYDVPISAFWLQVLRTFDFPGSESERLAGVPPHVSPLS